MQSIEVKSVLNKKKQRDGWFLDEYTVNMYSGCSMNCLYCYVRGSKYGENMAEKMSVKINAKELLEKQLRFRVKKGQYGFIVLSSSTDPYMPADERFGMTEHCLKLFEQFRFPVHVITKSDRVLRDKDLLSSIDKNAILPDDLATTLKRGTIVSFSISTLDENIASRLEPGAPLPVQRLEAMQQLSENGLLTGLNAMPLLPYMSDSAAQVEHIFAAAKKYKAHYVLASGLTLFGSSPGDSKVMYYKYLEKYYPQLVASYKSLYRIWPFPPKEYQNDLYQLVAAMSKKYGIRTSIVPPTV